MKTHTKLCIKLAYWQPTPLCFRLEINYSALDQILWSPECKQSYYVLKIFSVCSTPFLAPATPANNISRIPQHALFDYHSRPLQSWTNLYIIF